MKFDLASSRAVALLALIASVEAVGHDHRHGHYRRPRHPHRNIHAHPADVDISVEKRGGQCQFPTDAGLVSVTPDKQNAGWAMSPNQPCLPGNYCPYACPPGQVSMQWDPKATSYSYPMSMNGGLYCDESGQIQKPFPDRPYCQDGTGAVAARNRCGGEVAFCQTVLPGNEAMLIPTLVKELTTLAVPGTDYWCETAAHYYINPPGTSTDVACVWGTSANPFGNWSPYVTGANTVGNGDTYVTIGWNPIYLEPTTPFRDVIPDFGVEIVCEGDGCNGLPCKIDPNVNKVNEMVGGGTVGAGGATFCVVTVPKGENAHVVVFENGSGSGGGGSGGSSSSSTPPSPTTNSPTHTAPSSTSSTSSTPSTTPPSTPPAPPSATIPSTNSTSSTVSSSSTVSASSTAGTSSTVSTSTFPPSSMHSPTISSSSMHPSSSASPSSSKLAMSSHSVSYSPHVFAETNTRSPPTSTSSPSSTPISTSAASSASLPMLGMILSVVAVVLNM